VRSLPTTESDRKDSSTDRDIIPIDHPICDLYKKATVVRQFRQLLCS
jgi:hypothetical protein